MSIVLDLAAKVLEGTITPPDDEGLKDKCPKLWDLVTQDRYDDKERTRRQLAEIAITRVSGGYALVLKDHETCQQLEAFSTTFDGIATALEQAMNDPTRAWKTFKSYRNRKGPSFTESVLHKNGRKK
jgi:hypothetical protein